MDISIIMITSKQNENVKKVINSIRDYAGPLEIELILIDYNLNNGMWEWAQNQNDFTYVYFDENESVGKMLNDVIKELAIHNSILFLDGNQILTYGAIDRLWDSLVRKTDIGGACALTNDIIYLPNDVQNHLDSLNEWLTQNNPQSENQIIAYGESGILIRSEVIAECGKFDEDAPYLRDCMLDYCVRMSQIHYKMMLCDNVIMWNLDENKEIGSENVSETQDSYMEKKWGIHYFTIVPNDFIISVITADKEKEINVLEVGCDCGANLLGVRNRFPKANLYGCEINQASVNIAKELFTCVQANIEDYNLPYKEHFFDYIIFGDVLEHLRNPLGTIVYCKKLLKKNGHIVASIPNVANISIVEDLLKGNFTYTDFGLMDKTHIHMFTYNEIVRMFETAKFQELRIGSNTIPVSDRQQKLIEQLIQIEPNGTEAMYKTFQYLVDASNFIE